MPDAVPQKSGISALAGSVVEGLANAASTRNYVSAVAGAGTVFVALGYMDQNTAHQLADQCKAFMDGLGQMIGAGKNITLIVGPVILAVCAKAAGLAATLHGRLTSIAADPKVEIKGQIVVPPEVAAKVDSEQVVAPTK